MAARTTDTDLTVNGTMNATLVRQAGAALVLASQLSTNGKGVVAHGSTAGTARPSGFASIEWQGSVEPTNAVDGDTWVDTTP